LLQPIHIPVINLPVGQAFISLTGQRSITDMFGKKPQISTSGLIIWVTPYLEASSLITS
jgi:hypothetical protein